MRILHLVPWMVVLALLVGCRPEAGPEAEAERERAPMLVASWDGGRLTQTEYEDWLALQGVEPDDEYAARLAVLMSLADAAEARGADRETEVQLAVEAARHQILLPMLDGALDREVEISDEEIEALRLDRPGAFVRPRRVKMSGLFKRLPLAEAERIALAEQMHHWRDEVIAGRALGPLAAAESDSQSRFRDGVVGWVELDELPAAIRTAVEGLNEGEISAVTEHAGGLAFYRVDEIRERVEPSAEEVRFKLRQNLFRQRRAEIGRVLNASLADSITVDPSGDPVVRVGQYLLPRSSVEALAELRIPDRAPETLNGPQRLRLLREWAQRVALADEAERRGLHRDPEAAAALRWVMPNALAAHELRHRVDGRLAEPGESELRALFDAHSARLRAPEGLQLAVIRFADQPDPPAERLTEAQRVVRAVQGGELSFEQAAREYSLHPSAVRGGLLPWLSRAEVGALDLRLLAPLRALEPGEDTGLIRSDAGLWFARLVDRRPARPLTFEEARERLVEIHRQERIRRFEQDVQDEQRARIRLAQPPVSDPGGEEAAGPR